VVWDSNESQNLKKQKNKNSELLSQYREKLRTTESNSSEDKSKKHIETSSEDPNKIPKVKTAFRGVMLDNSDEIDTVKKKSYKKRGKHPQKNRSNFSKKKGGSYPKRSTKTSSLNKSNKTGRRTSSKRGRKFFTRKQKPSSR
jgi:hypothetical protein